MRAHVIYPRSIAISRDQSMRESDLAWRGRLPKISTQIRAIGGALAEAVG
jgi:hypothetical protein